MNIAWHLKKICVRTAIFLLKLTGFYDGYFSGWRSTFDVAETRGLHILPVHHYTPLPDTRTLPDEHWSIERSLPATLMMALKA